MIKPEFATKAVNDMEAKSERFGKARQLGDQNYLCPWKIPRLSLQRCIMKRLLGEWRCELVRLAPGVWLGWLSPNSSSLWVNTSFYGFQRVVVFIPVSVDRFCVLHFGVGECRCVCLTSLNPSVLRAATSGCYWSYRSLLRTMHTWSSFYVPCVKRLGRVVLTNPPPDRQGSVVLHPKEAGPTSET